MQGCLIEHWSYPVLYAILVDYFNMIMLCRVASLNIGRILPGIAILSDYYKMIMLCRVASMNIGRILPGIAILSGRIFVCGGEVDSEILANGEVTHL
jgi:hypothetical protein